MAQTLARDRDGAAVDGVGPEDRTDELGAAGADEAGDAEHLARVHLERHVLEYAVPGQVLDRQQWLLGLPELVWVLRVDGAADHEADKFCARRGSGHLADRGAVPEHRDPGYRSPGPLRGGGR
jgi:hypothetical protein